MKRVSSPVVVTAHRHVRIGISSCLAGEKVRYDGNDKRDHYITGTLGHFFEFVPVCPEMAIGLGVPRPPIQLVGNAKKWRAVGVADPTLDVTDKLAAYGARMAHDLEDISGYIFKSKSPSCGMERVKVYAPGRVPSKSGTGVYAAAFMAVQTTLPVEEEERLGDMALRENFLERVFAYRRWQDLTAPRLTVAKLVEFHACHKLTLMAHSINASRALGRLVARAGRSNLQDVAEEYIHGFMQALRQPATRRRHTNVLMHLMGYLKRYLDAADKRELLELLEAYRLEQAPLVAPLTLLNHHFRRFPNLSVARQTYLHPPPGELLWRSST